jgi:hypothetical protein
MINIKKTQEFIGAVSQVHTYEVVIESHIYEGKRVWSVYEGNTYRNTKPLNSESEAREFALEFIKEQNGKKVYHKKD